MTRNRITLSSSLAAAVAIAFALLLTAQQGGAFGDHLAHSLAIAAACAVIAEGTRSLLARMRPVTADPASGDSASALFEITAATALATLSGPVLGTALVDRLLGNEVPALTRWSDGMVRMTFALAALGTLVTLTGARMAERIARESARAQRAQRSATEFRLRLLESQLEPHLLFNTLAHLGVMIDDDPRAARIALGRLTSYFSHTLAGSRAGVHTLRDEAARIDDYLGIISMRMGPRLTFRLDVPAELGALRVPALIAQPLVENAVRHGLEHKVGAGLIEVAATRRGDMLVLDVRDTGDGFDPKASRPTTGSGFGIVQVRERLDSIYGSRASLEFLPARAPTVADTRGGTVARLRIPISGGQEP